MMSELPDHAAPIGGVAMNIETGELGASPIEASRPSLWEQARPLILIVWLLGSGFILVWSLVRVYRFDRLLRAGCQAAPSDVQARAARIAGQLGLRFVPTIYITTAKLSPSDLRVMSEIMPVLGNP